MNRYIVLRGHVASQSCNFNHPHDGIGICVDSPVLADFRRKATRFLANCLRTSTHTGDVFRRWPAIRPHVERE
jgi:hypothetical protein